VNRLFEIIRLQFRLDWQFIAKKICGKVWIIGLSAVVISGCGGAENYREEHHISNLNIVFLDQQSLHKEWTARTGQPGVEFAAFHGQSIPQVKMLHGFFDFMTNTLYCPKWNFEVCGHELHHAVLGHFHPAH
jgi:hypothetical protein